MVVVPEDPHSHWIVLLDIEDFSLRAETTQATLHDDLYHVVLIGALYLLYRGGRLLETRPA